LLFGVLPVMTSWTSLCTCFAGKDKSIPACTVPVEKFSSKRMFDLANWAAFRNHDSPFASSDVSWL
jgi:hypothetical protein